MKKKEQLKKKTDCVLLACEHIYYGQFHAHSNQCSRLLIAYVSSLQCTHTHIKSGCKHEQIHEQQKSQLQWYNMSSQAMPCHGWLKSWNTGNPFFQHRSLFIHIEFQLSTVEAMLFVHTNENEGKEKQEQKSKTEQNESTAIRSIHHQVQFEWLLICIFIITIWYNV